MLKPFTLWITTNCGKLLKTLEYQTILPASWETGQEATVRMWHGTTDWFPTGKGIYQGYMLSPCLLNLQAEYMVWNAGLDEAQAGIKIARRNIYNLRYADNTTLIAESEEELKSLLMRVEEESEKSGLKLNTLKTKIMASYPITSWQIDGETMETVTDLIFSGSNITVDDDCHEMKRCLLLGKTNLDILLKNRDITLPAKVHIVKAMVFPVVVYGFESWTIKKAECQRIDAFNLWCWRRLLRVPWTKRRSNQSIKSTLNSHWKDWCWRWSSNTLATWCDDLTHWKRPWCWKRLRAGGKGVTEDEMVGWHHQLSAYESEQTLDRRAWCAAADGVTESGHDWVTEHNESYWCMF